MSGYLVQSKLPLSTMAPPTAVGVAVHVLGGGVGHDVRPPLERLTADGGGEGVVHDEGHAVAVGGLGELLQVQHDQGGVGDGLAKDGLGVGAEGGVQLRLGAVRVHKGKLDAHPLHGHGEEVEGAAVDGGRGHHMVPGGADVEDGEEVGRLAGRGQHSCRAALQGADLRSHPVRGGVLQAGVEVTGCLQVKQGPHGLAGGIAEGGALHNGDVAGFAVFRHIPGVEALGAVLIVLHG